MAIIVGVVIGGVATFFLDDLTLYQFVSDACFLSLRISKYKNFGNDLGNAADSQTLFMLIYVLISFHEESRVFLLCSPAAHYFW